MMRHSAYILTILLILLASQPSTQLQAQATNLITNPGFEQDLSPWVTCGGAKRVTDKVHSGKYALRLGNPTNESCPAPPPGLEYRGRVDQALTQNLRVAANAPALTVSFWYYVQGNANTDVWVILSDNLYTSNYSSVETVGLDTLLPGDQPGWHLFRQVLTSDQLAQVKQWSNLKFQLRMDDPLAASDQLAIYIDDVAIVPAKVTTAASAMPAELASYQGLPLVFTHDEPNNPDYSNYIARINPNGSGLTRIFTGYLHDAFGPTWSPDGRQIAVIDGNVYPLNERDPNKYVSATALMLMNANGSNPRSIYQTAGTPGEDDFITKLTELSWAPDGQSLAAGTFAYIRKSNNTLEGGLAEIYQIAANSPHTSNRLLSFATKPDWGSNNKILFETYDLSSQNRTGISISELNLNQQPATERPLLQEAKLRYNHDETPVWSPDGGRFVTVRYISGNWRDSSNTSYYNQALMLINPEDTANPRMLLLGDHGRLSYPTWSPDGKYIVYTLNVNGRSDLWWLNVASGATGPITSDGQSWDAEWQPTSGPSRSIYLPMARR